MEGFLDSLPGHRLFSRSAGEQERALGTIEFPVLSQYLQAIWREKGISVFKVFTSTDKQLHVFAVDVLYMEIKGFSNTQVGSIAGKKDDFVTGIVDV